MCAHTWLLRDTNEVFEVCVKFYSTGQKRMMSALVINLESQRCLCTCSAKRSLIFSLSGLCLFEENEWKNFAKA